MLKRDKAFNLKASFDYADGSIASNTLIKIDIGNVTLFVIDAGQGQNKHMAFFDGPDDILDTEAEITIGGQRNSRTRC